MTCANCKYGLVPDGQTGAQPVAICKRYPPTVIMVGMARHAFDPKAPPQPQTMSFWPQLSADEECGEFLLEPKLQLS